MTTETVKKHIRRLNQERKMKAVVYRACSGTGKSTLAKQLRNNYGAKVFSADDFFSQSGNYEFNVQLLSEAHLWCLKGWIEACQNQWPFVVCDNTNTSVAEMAPYVQVAQVYGYNVEVVTLIVDPKVAYGRASHGAALEIVEKQHAQLVAETERIPRWWRHTVIDLNPKPETTLEST